MNLTPIQQKAVLLGSSLFVIAFVTLGLLYFDTQHKYSEAESRLAQVEKRLDHQEQGADGVNSLQTALDKTKGDITTLQLRQISDLRWQQDVETWQKNVEALLKETGMTFDVFIKWGRGVDAALAKPPQSPKLDCTTVNFGTAGSILKCR